MIWRYRTGSQIRDIAMKNRIHRLVFKGRRDEPQHLRCISKAASKSLKHSSDVLVSDECDIDKLLKLGVMECCFES